MRECSDDSRMVALMEVQSAHGVSGWRVLGDEMRDRVRVRWFRVRVGALDVR